MRRLLFMAEPLVEASRRDDHFAEPLFVAKPLLEANWRDGYVAEPRRQALTPGRGGCPWFGFRFRRC